MESFERSLKRWELHNKSENFNFSYFQFLSNNNIVAQDSPIPWVGFPYYAER